MAALFIDKAYLDKHSSMSVQLDYARITPIIELVQFKYIKKLLGHDLYTKLTTDNPTHAGVYKTLLDNYLRPAMVWYIQAEASTALKYRIEPKGVFEAAVDGYNPITPSALTEIVDAFKNNAEAYAEEGRRYILQNESSFPEYSSNSGLDENAPSTSGYGSGIYFSGCVCHQLPCVCCE
jgi:hypothetical protein